MANLTGLTIRSIDVMKKTKDTITSQLSDAEILDLVTRIKTAFNPTHIAIAIPYDTDAAFRAKGTVPAPRTAEAHYQKWCDTIHNAGIAVLHRGTWSACENIWGFPYATGGNFIAQGTAASAATDGTSTWLGKCRTWIVSNPTYFANGDIYAPIPEPTGHAFDGNSFISSGGSGLITNMAAFYNDLITVANAAFASISKTVTAGYTANNYSEIRSGWLPASIFNNAGVVAADYYGNYDGDSNYTAAKYQTDLTTIANAKGKPVMWQEWGDIVTFGQTDAQRTTYFESILAMIQTMNGLGLITGFNYWGGWEDNQNTGILFKDSNGKYQIDSRGQLLADAFNPLPQAPSALTSSIVSATEVSLAWTDNSQNETGFRIERKVNASYVEIGTVGPNVTSYSDKTASANTTYTYRVRAYNNAGNSAYSGATSATTPPAVLPVVIGPRIPYSSHPRLDGRYEYYGVSVVNNVPETFDR